MLQLIRVQLVDQLNTGEIAGLSHRQRTAKDKAAIRSRSTVAVGQFRINANDFAVGRFEVREIGPRQLEFDFESVIPTASRHFDSDFRDGIQVSGSQREPRIQFCFLHRRPETVNRTLAPFLIAKVGASSSVKVPFDGIAFPKRLHGRK